MYKLIKTLIPGFFKRKYYSKLSYYAKENKVLKIRRNKILFK